MFPPTHQGRYFNYDHSILQIIALRHGKEAGKEQNQDLKLQHLSIPTLYVLIFFLVATCGIFNCGMGTLSSHVRSHSLSFPDQGLNPRPLPWELRVLATEPPGKSLSLFIDLTADMY